MLVPYLFNNVMATLVLVVFVELSAGQPDILREISLQLLILLPSIPQTAKPKHHGQVHCLLLYIQVMYTEQTVHCDYRYILEYGGVS